MKALKVLIKPSVITMWRSQPVLTRRTKRPKGSLLRPLPMTLTPCGTLDLSRHYLTQRSSSCSLHSLLAALFVVCSKNAITNANANANSIMTAEHLSDQYEQASVSSSHLSNHGGSKGRKGDPRMHKAVAARMERPDLTLFQALQAGGFGYPSDDDAGCFDSEQVTLGQRKNQLSRRLRLAKKHQADGNTSHHNYSSTSSSACEVAPQPSFASVANIKLPTTGITLPLDHQIMPLTGLKRGPSETPLEEDSTEAEAIERSRLMAKNHPQYNPYFVPQVPLHNVPATATGGQAQPPAAVQVQHQPALFGNEAFGMPFQQLPTGQLVQAQLAQQAAQQQLAAAAAAQAPQPVADPTTAATAAAPAALVAPSGVAITSLSRTAASVGLTLEQLALALGNSSTLATVLTETTPDKQQALALNLYSAEAQSVYTKSMLLAGYQPAHCQGAAYAQFCLAAWQQEGQRLQSIMTQVPADAPLEVNTAAGTEPALAAAAATPVAAAAVQAGHSHSHGHEHGHEHHTTTTADGHGECYLDGRHIHRLEGKCGHKAILHQPANGEAHIDFLVGNKVECYQHTKPIAPHNSGNISVWPSKFNSHDLERFEQKNASRGKGGIVHGVTHATVQEAAARPLGQHQAHEGPCTNVNSPKILDLEDIDFDSKEWNSAFADGQIDETLLGLIKLGGNHDGNEHAHSSDHQGV